MLTFQCFFFLIAKRLVVLFDYHYEVVREGWLVRQKIEEEEHGLNQIELVLTIYVALCEKTPTKMMFTCFLLKYGSGIKYNMTINSKHFLKTLCKKIKNGKKSRFPNW